jgi:hypothetical protein
MMAVALEHIFEVLTVEHAVRHVVKDDETVKSSFGAYQSDVRKAAGDLQVRKQFPQFRDVKFLGIALLS